jgi:hypothetical protein
MNADDSKELSIHFLGDDKDGNNAMSYWRLLASIGG